MDGVVQTFLPYPTNFEKTARCLDSQRLGNQRMEALIVLQTCLAGEAGGWKHHPCVKMWRGHEYTLARYGHTLSLEWAGRGYRDIMGATFAKYLADLDVTPLPPWLDHPLLRRTHRSNLVRKDPSHYRQFWPTIASNMPYYWPTPHKIKLRVKS